jgi:dynein heavy chain 2
VEQLLESGGSLETFKSQLEQQLSQFTQVKIADPLMSMKLKSLVLDIIHHIEVINALLKAGKR